MFPPAGAVPAALFSGDDEEGSGAGLAEVEVAAFMSGDESLRSDLRRRLAAMRMAQCCGKMPSSSK